MNIKRTTKARIAAIAVAAAATFAVAPGATAQAETIKSDVGLWMQYQPAGNGVGTAFIFGGVSADHKACLNTTIYFGQQRNQDPNTWNYSWNFRNVTKKDSGYTIYLNPSETGNVQYTSWTDKQVIRKNGNKIVCNYGKQWDLLYAN